jgi:hypothetical protein
MNSLFSELIKGISLISSSQNKVSSASSLTIFNLLMKSALDFAPHASVNWMLLMLMT